MGTAHSRQSRYRAYYYNMADAPRGRGGFGDRGRGDRGRGDRRGRRGSRRGGPKSDEKEWQPVTKLGRLVKAGKIQSMEQIYLHSLPIKEYQIVDWFLPKLKDEVMKIKPAQKQTRAGQRTRFKAIVIIGDSEGHVGLGIKTSKEVATAIRAAIIIAKLSVLPIRRGYCGTGLVAVGNTYGYLTPNLWKETKLIRSPLEEFGDVLRAGKRYQMVLFCGSG